MDYLALALFVLKIYLLRRFQDEEYVKYLIWI